MMLIKVELLIIMNFLPHSMEDQQLVQTIKVDQEPEAQMNLLKLSERSSYLEEQEDSLVSKDNSKSWMTITLSLWINTNSPRP